MRQCRRGNAVYASEDQSSCENKYQLEFSDFSRWRIITIIIINQFDLYLVETIGWSVDFSGT